jgi:hypothetical protein
MSLIKATDSDKGTRLRGRDPRTQSTGTKLTVNEERMVLRAAQQQGKVPAEWVREALLRAAAPTSELTALFIEVQALRLLLVNTLEPLLRGERMAPEQFKEMLRYVKTNKQRAAEDTLASYGATHGGT